MFKLNIFDKISFFAVILGAINWGGIGLLNINLLYILTGGISIILRIVYILILISLVNLQTIYYQFKFYISKLSKHISSCGIFITLFKNSDVGIERFRTSCFTHCLRI